MAHHKSAVKRHMQSINRAARNKAARTRVKNAVKAVRAAVQNRDREGAESLLPTAASVLARAAGKKAIHRRKAARKLSRLAKAVNAVSVAVSA